MEMFNVKYDSLNYIILSNYDKDRKTLEFFRSVGLYTGNYPTPNKECFNFYSKHFITNMIKTY